MRGGGYFGGGGGQYVGGCCADGAGGGGSGFLSPTLIKEGSFSSSGSQVVVKMKRMDHSRLIEYQLSNRL